jgi:replicative DNA helicase
LNEEDWEKLTMAMSTLSEAPIFIDDTPGVTVYDIRAKLRRLKAEHGLGLVVIDYLQLISGRGGDSRQQEISEISRSLKLLAREFDVPVIALSQLSRAVEQRQDKRPMLSDLRESGSIEQDADVVTFLYRDDYYNEESEKQNIAELIIGKQRNGPVGKVELLFLKNYNKFLSLEMNRTPIPE